VAVNSYTCTCRSVSLDEIKDHLSHQNVAIVLVDCNLLHCLRCHNVRSAIGVGMHSVQFLSLFCNMLRNCNFLNGGIKTKVATVHSFTYLIFIWQYSYRLKEPIMEILCGAKTVFTLLAINCRKWTDLVEIWSTVSTLLSDGPGRFWVRSAQ